MADQEQTVSRLYRIRKTVMEMLRDRGYLVLDVEINMSKMDFVNKFGEGIKREDLIINKSKKNDPSDQIYVFFPNDDKVGMKHIKKYVELMKSENVPRAIYISCSAEFDSICKNIHARADSEVSLGSFLVGSDDRILLKETELLINIKDHVLVPEHQVLTSEEKKSLLERYTLKETQLPRMQLTDSVARYYGLTRGQVVKIIRPSETAGRYVTYRYVV